MANLTIDELIKACGDEIRKEAPKGQVTCPSGMSNDKQKAKNEENQRQ